MKPTTPPARPGIAAVWQQRPLYIQAGWMSLISGTLLLASSWYMFEVYGRVLDSRSLRTLLMLLLCVLGIYLVATLLEYVRARILNRAAAAVDAELRMQVFNAAFDATLRRAPGGTPQAFTDLRTLREFISSPAVTAALDIPAALLFLALMFAISFWLGVMAALGGLVQSLLLLSTERRTLPPLVEAATASNAAMQYAGSTLRNAPVIEAMGMLDHIHGRWLTRQRRFLALQTNASDNATSTASVAKSVQTMQGSLLLGGACLLLLEGQLPGGGSMMIVASILGGRVLAPLSQLINNWRTVVGARDAYARIAALLSQHVPRPKGMPLPPPKGVLTVEAVTAGAGPQAPAILRNVSFGLRPGDAVCVIGPAAAGKTTLARVLIGVWPAMAGKVRLDGVDVHGWTKDELGPHVGYVPQAVELFDGTIAENIARFGKVDLELVRKAADAVGLTETIEAMSAGFDTPIGDEGAILSGGQRQRLALARAVYGDPTFLVLDEPNSSLDEAGDKALQQMIASARERAATVVVISHRMSILPVVNKLLVLREGQVAMFGGRDEVLQALKKAADEARQATRQLAPGSPPATPRKGVA